MLEVSATVSFNHVLDSDDTSKSIGAIAGGAVGGPGGAMLNGQDS